MGKRNLRRQDLLERVSACVIHHHGLKGLTLQGVAEATGLSLWALRYGFENVECLFKAVVEASVERIRQLLRYDRPARGAVIDSLRDYAGFIAEAMKSEDYRNFLFLVVRNGGDQAWLQEAYERRVIGAIVREIEALVLKSGEFHGTTILLKEGAARRFVKKIEAELVLPSLLPPFRPALLTEEALEGLLRGVAREAFEATYAFAWEPASAA